MYQSVRGEDGSDAEAEAEEVLAEEAEEAERVLAGLGTAEYRDRLTVSYIWCMLTVLIAAQQD